MFMKIVKLLFLSVLLFGFTSCDNTSPYDEYMIVPPSVEKPIAEAELSSVSGLEETLLMIFNTFSQQVPDSQRIFKRDIYYLDNQGCVIQKEDTQTGLIVVGACPVTYDNRYLVPGVHYCWNTTSVIIDGILYSDGDQDVISQLISERDEILEANTSYFTDQYILYEFGSFGDFFKIGEESGYYATQTYSSVTNRSKDSTEYERLGTTRFYLNKEYNGVLSFEVLYYKDARDVPNQIFLRIIDGENSGIVYSYAGAGFQQTTY